VFARQVEGQPWIEYALNATVQVINQERNLSPRLAAMIQSLESDPPVYRALLDYLEKQDARKLVERIRRRFDSRRVYWVGGVQIKETATGYEALELGRPNVIPLPTADGVYSLAFASASRFFVGTAGGEVYQGDRSGTGWNTKRLDNAVAGVLGVTGLVSDIAIDWSDATLSSIYVTFGGVGDSRQVWHFDGTRWDVRSGPLAGGPGGLMNVEHNAIVVDRLNPTNIYVGADIGVWHSSDSGQSWEPLSNGLPDAPVFDVQIHPTRRLLRASTHGRGLYEIPL